MDDHLTQNKRDRESKRERERARERGREGESKRERERERERESAALFSWSALGGHATGHRGLGYRHKARREGVAKES